MTLELQQKYVKLLEEQYRNDDYESAHSNADDLLCDLLLELGYDEVVEAWDGVGKWYA
jgi:hypothetical protein